MLIHFISFPCSFTSFHCIPVLIHFTSFHSRAHAFHFIPVPIHFISFHSIQNFYIPFSCSFHSRPLLASHSLRKRRVREPLPYYGGGKEQKQRSLSWKSSLDEPRGPMPFFFAAAAAFLEPALRFVLACTCPLQRRVGPHSMRKTLETARAQLYRSRVFQCNLHDAFMFRDFPRFSEILEFPVLREAHRIGAAETSFQTRHGFLITFYSL